MADAGPVEIGQPAVALTALKLRIVLCQLKIQDCKKKLAENERRICLLERKLFFSEGGALRNFGGQQGLRATIRAMTDRTIDFIEEISHHTAWLERLKKFDKEDESGRVTIRINGPFGPNFNPGAHGFPPFPAGA